MIINLSGSFFYCINSIKKQFINDEKGRIWIKKIRIKTGVLSRIPLLPIPKLILEKYKGGLKLHPVIDISSTDSYLKKRF